MDIEQKVDEVVEAPVVEDTPVVVDEVEVEAKEHGWKTKEEFLASGGKEEDYKSARQFQKETDLFRKIETLNKELKNTRSTLNALKGHYEKVKETEFKHALDVLKAQKKRALDEGDSDAVIDIDDRIDQVKETQRQVNQVKAQPTIHPDFTEWVNQNNWYQTDTELQNFADTVGRSYAQANPGIDPKEVLKYVSNRVKKAYPDKFKNVRREAPSPVEGSRSQGKPKADSYELDELETQVMNKLVRQGLLTKEQYIADLKKVKGAK